MIASLTTIGIIALGGALGAVARHGVNTICAHMSDAAFPWATLIVNVIGSFLMGVAIVKLSQIQLSGEISMFVRTGFLGAFTTFSTFSLDAVTLWQKGEMIYAGLYIITSVVCSISALLLALWIMKGSTI